MKKNLFPLLRIDVSRKRGVSLVETIIALLILSIALLAIAAVPIMSTKLALQAALREQATAVGMRELDALEADSSNSIAERTVDTGFSVFSALSSKQNGTGRVTVSWQGSSLVLERSLSDYSSENRRVFEE